MSKKLPRAYEDLASQIEETVDTDCKDTHCFAVILEDDSMAPHYLKDDRVVFAPNAPIEPGQAAIVKLKDGRVMFRYFYQIDPQRILLIHHGEGKTYSMRAEVLEIQPEQISFCYPAYAIHRKVSYRPPTPDSPQ